MPRCAAVARETGAILAAASRRYALRCWSDEERQKRPRRGRGLFARWCV